MKKRLFILVSSIFIICCKNKKNSYDIKNTTVFDTIKQETNNHFKYVPVKIKEKIIKLLVPTNEVFKEKLYDEEQAAKIIHLNLDLNIKKKIAPSLLLKLLRFQGDFLEAKDEKNQNYLDYNDENSVFLKEQMKLIGIDLKLSEQEIKKIIKIESYYMELINYK